MGRVRSWFTGASLGGNTYAETLGHRLTARLRGAIGEVRVGNPYEEVPVVYRAVNVIAGAMVDGELGVWRRRKTGDPERETSGPAVDLLANPTADESGAAVLTRSDFLFVLVAQSMLARSAGCLVQAGNVTGSPVRLLPLPPGSLTALRPQRDPWTLLGWRFTGGGTTVFLRPDEAVRFKFAPDIHDPMNGVGPAIPAQVAMDTRLAATLYNKFALENGGSLGGILQFEDDQPLDDHQTAEVRRRFNERQWGLTNVERVAVISGRFKWIETGKSAKDMQWGAALGATREDIASAFGIPLLFLGVADHAALSRATVQVEKALLYENQVLHVAGRFADVFTTIVRRFDTELFCKWDFSKIAALKDDEGARLERMRVLLAAGYPLNEVNRVLELGMPEMPWGDGGFVQAGLVPAGEVVASTLDVETAEAGPAPRTDSVQIAAALDVVKSVAAGQLPRDAAAGILETLLGLSHEQAEQVLGSAGTTTAVLAPEPAQRAVPDVRTRLWRSYVRAVQPYEDAILGAYRRGMARLRAVVLAALDDTRSHVRSGAGDVTAAFEPEVLARIMGPAIRRAYTAGTERAVDELVDIGLASDAVAEAERGRLPKLADSYWDARSGRIIRVGDRIRAEVHDAVLSGYEAGENLSDIKDRVRDVFNGNMTEKRARQIARTEAHTATSNGRFGLLQRQGIEEHEWLSARDEHVRESHLRVDGDRVEVGTEFSNGLKFPGDPGGEAGEVINCRCTTLPVARDLEAFAEQTAAAAHLDAAELALCVRHSPADLARRALHLGMPITLPVVARCVPELLDCRSERTADALAAQVEAGLLANPAVASAVQILGGIEFVERWSTARR